MSQIEKLAMRRHRALRRPVASRPSSSSRRSATMTVGMASGRGKSGGPDAASTPSTRLVAIAH